MGTAAGVASSFLAADAVGRAGGGAASKFSSSFSHCTSSSMSVAFLHDSHKAPCGGRFSHLSTRARISPTFIFFSSATVIRDKGLIVSAGASAATGAVLESWRGSVNSSSSIAVRSTTSVGAGALAALSAS